MGAADHPLQSKGGWKIEKWARQQSYSSGGPPRGSPLTAPHCSRSDDPHLRGPQCDVNTVRIAPLAWLAPNRHSSAERTHVERREPRDPSPSVLWPRLVFLPPLRPSARMIAGCWRCQARMCGAEVPRAPPLCTSLAPPLCSFAGRAHTRTHTRAQEEVHALSHKRRACAFASTAERVDEGASSAYLTRVGSRAREAATHSPSPPPDARPCATDCLPPPLAVARGALCCQHSARLSGLCTGASRTRALTRGCARRVY